ncbi:hypothetical protein A3K55_02290 [Candidatus Shapirobacteria bacterium RBG_13_44_7]|uniref:Small ribosomal subunit protein bS20 n=1 Tax=Candidatus Shapirobacteria bacterium RBG_13_44_7 TaxID=1802149 RepID=A0A1F7SJK8_9BACT|nr:MAG: hypothetical protein A3K55_02290 [Candidatus Shapirobacteria bacterium RBG_13_44_7]
MPIGRSAKKSLRKAQRQNQKNTLFRKTVRVAVKNFLKKPTIETWKKVSSVLDKAVKKNIVHQNKAARLKSRYSVLVKTETKKTEVVKKTAPKKKTAKKMS